MDLFDVLKACARRWFVFVPLLVVTILVAYNNYSGVKPVFFANVSVGLTAPSSKQQTPLTSTPVTVNSNGLVDAGGVGYLATLLSSALNEPGTKASVEASGGQVDYSSKVFSLTSGLQVPIIVVSASGSTAAGVQKTLQLATAQAGPLLQAVQAGAGVPSEAQYRALPPSEIPAPGGGYPSRTRQGVATVLGGLLISVVVTVAIDSLLQAVRRRRRTRGNSTRSTAGTGSETPFADNADPARASHAL